MWHRSLTMALALAPLALACSGDAGRHGVPDAGGQVWARVAVVVTAPRDHEVTVDTAAWLLRFSDTDARSAQLLAGAGGPVVDPPSGCVDVDPDVSLEKVLEELSPDAQVSMLDAGELVYRVAGRAFAMQPRYVPDLIPFVTGAVYQSDEPTPGDPPAELGAEDEAVVSAFGGDDVGRFDVAAIVPPVPRIAEVMVEDGALVVTWSAVSAESDVVVTVQGRERGLRCRVRDAGRASLRGEAVTALLGDAAEISVERTTRAPFAAAGIEGGELVVTARDHVPLAP